MVSRSLPVVVLLSALSLSAASDKPLEVTIQSGAYRLHGCAWTPDGPGPYPVMIYNHGSEPKPAPCGPPDLGYFYQKHGWAFVAFQRHGHEPSPGEYIGDLQKRAYLSHPFDRPAAQREINRLHELYNLDVEAAVSWVKQQKWADPGRLAMSGISYGGIQTLLTAEKGLGIRAFLPFAPAAQSWNPVLAERLKEAIRKARAPIFIIQAENDYSLEPSKVLGAELAKKGPPNRAKIYPAFGTTTQQGHGWFGSRAAGIAVWQADVLDFLKL
jgi:carboxymethylenebutenolidase